MALLFLPLTVKIGYKEKFNLSILFSGITVFKLKKTETKKKPKEIKEKDKSTKENKKNKSNVFKVLKEKYGYIKTIKILFNFANRLLTHIKKLLKHITVNKVIFNLSVTSDNAATTAVEYGAVCSVAYPVFALLSSVARVKLKQINLYADFESQKPRFDFELSITSRVFFLLLAAFGAFKEYKLFKEEYINERK